MKSKTRLERYHENYVTRRLGPQVATSPAAQAIEQRALELEAKGLFRVAAGLWLKCLDAAVGDVERQRIAMRRERCIIRGCARREHYCGVNAGQITDMWGLL
ncbi:PerC family transcriptional regulator [Cronobacter sakazakii]